MFVLDSVNSTTCELELADDTADDHIDAALNQLEKMLNDAAVSSSSPAGPDAGDDNDDHDGAYNHAAVDCTQIPRLTAQLSYCRSE